jgi:pimeloyl-ACP methyl ester carboxylesterase
MRGHLMAAACAALATVTPTVATNAADVAEIGSFHVGGRQVTLEGLPTKDVVFSAGMAPIKVDPNGDFHAEQMYVQYIKLNAPKARYPLLLWHGGGLSGVTWETKPDGKPGWQMFFLNAGHDVYVSDAVERGRASWSRFPEIFKGEPMFRTKKEAWELFRIGPAGSYATDPAQRIAHGGQLFPTTAFDQFALQGIPRWTTNDAATQAAYNALVARVCPCVIMVHSQGGNFGFNAALANPDKVKAIIAIEPSGAPKADSVDLARLRGVPHLFVWGDNLDKHEVWSKNIVKGPTAYHEALVKQATVSDWIDLPKAGIPGNTHMLMMDTNSDRIAQLIQDWMAKQHLMK